MASKPIVVIQGGQWGSEAKGAVAAHICRERNIDAAIRTGAINAGHTVVHNGHRYAMQQLPVGWVNPNTLLVVGGGAYIHPETLLREMEIPGIANRVVIDYRCGVHNEEAEQASKKANRHHRIGATGKGCSEAIVSKIRNRNDGYKLFEQTPDAKKFIAMGGKFDDTVQLLNDMHGQGAALLIEGTQGSALDLHFGPYPFTTSRMTNAANWVAESGLSPALDYEVILVVRTYPIRVAGNSGPMPYEIEWTDLAEEINGKLSRLDMPPMVSLIAIQEFKEKLAEAAFRGVSERRFSLPTNGRSTFNVRLSSWTAEERSTHRVAASELHRDALNLCTTGTVAQLKHLFEMTTVTKKLRRIARMSIGDLNYAITMNRPSSIVLTFLDYEHPALAGVTVDELPGLLSNPSSGFVGAIASARSFIKVLEANLGVPISAVSTGPAPGHIFPVSHLEFSMSGK